MSSGSSVKTDSKHVRLHVIITAINNSRLEKIAKRRGTTRTEVINSAIKVTDLFDEALARNARVQIVEFDGSVREVIFT